MKTILTSIFILMGLQICFSQEVNLPGGDSYDMVTAMNSINNNGTVIINGNINLNYTISVPEGITLRFINNYRINVPANVQFTINGSIDAGFHQIFNIDTNAFLTGSPKIKYVVPQWWQPASNNTDWSYAIQQATNFYPRVYFPKGTYNMVNSVILKTNISHYLFGEGKDSHLKMTNSNFIFKIKNSSNPYDKGLTINNLFFESVNGLQFNNNSTEFSNSNDNFQKIEISNCHFKSLGNGTAIYFSKVFDSEIKFNQIDGYQIGINLRGSDINSINNNRIINFKKFGILDESFKTFGSQNEISHNDILNYLGTVNQGAFIKTFSRHVTIKNNYLENTQSSNKVRAMIDCSNYSSNYPITPSVDKSFPYFINISQNRLDVTSSTSFYTYLIQDDFASLFIDDQSNINEYPPSKFINTDGNIFSNFIRSRFNIFREKNINLQSAISFGEWNGFKTKSIFDNAHLNSFIIDSKHAPSAITLTQEPTDLEIHPLYFKLNGSVPAYKVNLTQKIAQNGEKELPIRTKVAVTFRIKRFSPSTGNPTLYMRGDSETTLGGFYWSDKIGDNIEDEYQTISFTPSKKIINNIPIYIDYIKYLYIQPTHCDIEIKSIQISTLTE